MTNFKDILLHIFSKTGSLQDLGKENDNLKESFEKAQEYACGGKVSLKTQKSLQSIFDGLAGAEEKGYYFEPKELSIQDFNFPKKENPKSSSEDVFKKFKNDYELIRSFEGKAFAETCLALLEKYFCYVPCGVDGLDKVSLYDYIKLVAGFIVCLENPDIDKGKPFLLIGGDISGIQAFIYDIISTDASKNLKGRSFYLQLLVDSVIRKILKELDLFSANIIYASGGGFYILATNTENTIKKLEDLEKIISDAIFKTHKTAFSLVIDFVSIKSETILKDNLIINPDVKEESDKKTIWDTLIQKINRKQKCKHQHQILVGFESFFGNEENGQIVGIEIGGNQERDAITGEEISDEEFKDVDFPIDFLDKDEYNKPIKYTTNQQIELGRKLKDTKYIIHSNKELKYFGDTFDICGLGNHYYFLSKEDFDKKAEDFKNYNKSELTIIALNDFENEEKVRVIDFLALKLGVNHIYIFSFYGGNDYPYFKEIKENKTFSELAGQRELDREKKYGEIYKKLMPEPSYKRLGVLRMDVDGLGAIFSSKELNNLLKYSVLSRSLDYFFKGYLNTIWSSNLNFKENTQIIYSGGDDLFIVGRWDILIEFAEQIKEKFECWTCYNEELGISGGIAVVPSKYPIAKAAKQSEELEKTSKTHQYTDKEELEKINSRKAPIWEKNAICFLDEKIPLHWKYEYPIVKDLKILLQDFVEKTKNNSILQRIQAFNVQKKNQEVKDLTHSWRWLLAYDFARFRDRIKKENQVEREFINQLKTNIFFDTYEHKKMQSQYTFIELLALAARWAELENRTRKKMEN